MQQFKSVLYCMIKKVMVKTFNLSVRKTMKYKTLAAAIPLVLTLSACTTVDPVFKDIGTRSAPCVDGGPDTVAQKFYDLLIKAQSGHKVDIAATPNEKSGARDGDVFSSLFDGPTSATVDSASTIPNTDARNIPLRVTMSHQKDNGAKSTWKDEVLMVREGQCWAVDDVRYMANLDFASSGSLRQVLEHQ